MGFPCPGFPHVLPQLATTELPDRKRLSQRARDAIVERIANC